MKLHLYRVEDGYLVCPADKPVPATHAFDLKDKRPDMVFLSRDTVMSTFIEEHIRCNGAVQLDPAVADMMFAGYQGWIHRTF